MQTDFFAIKCIVKRRLKINILSRFYCTSSDSFASLSWDHSRVCFTFTPRQTRAQDRDRDGSLKVSKALPLSVRWDYKRIVWKLLRLMAGMLRACWMRFARISRRNPDRVWKFVKNKTLFVNWARLRFATNSDRQTRIFTHVLNSTKLPKQIICLLETPGLYALLSTQYLMRGS